MERACLGKRVHQASVNILLRRILRSEEPIVSQSDGLLLSASLLIGLRISAFL